MRIVLTNAAAHDSAEMLAFVYFPSRDRELDTIFLNDLLINTVTKLALTCAYSTIPPGSAAKLQRLQLAEPIEVNVQTYLGDL